MTNNQAGETPADPASNMKKSKSYLRSDKKCLSVWLIHLGPLESLFKSIILLKTRSEIKKINKNNKKFKRKDIEPYNCELIALKKLRKDDLRKLIWQPIKINLFFQSTNQETKTFDSFLFIFNWKIKKKDAGHNKL